MQNVVHNARVHFLKTLFLEMQNIVLNARVHSLKCFAYTYDR